MSNTQQATIFFLPIEDRPKTFPPLENFKGKFWHTGIIYNSNVYECFNNEKSSITEMSELKKNEMKEAVFIKSEIDIKKLQTEIKSGTDCAEFIARCTGLSELTGNTKGNLWPEDVYNLLLKRMES